MYQVFNMGLGMVVVCKKENVEPIRKMAPEISVVGRTVPRENDAQVIMNDA